MNQLSSCETPLEGPRMRILVVEEEVVAIEASSGHSGAPFLIRTQSQHQQNELWLLELSDHGYRPWAGSS